MRPPNGDQDRHHGQSLLAIMGCHGIGKSTVQEALKAKFDGITPAAKLRNAFPDNAILSYIHYLVERKKQHTSLVRHYGRIITDRYAFVDTSIYVSVLNDLGHISAAELDLFRRILENLDGFWLAATALVILVCDPLEILRRLETRKRSSSCDFDPFDLEQIVAVNAAFREFGTTGALPRFVEPLLGPGFAKVPRIVIDTTRESVAETVRHVAEEIRDIWPVY